MSYYDKKGRLRNHLSDSLPLPEQGHTCACGQGATGHHPHCPMYVEAEQGEKCPSCLATDNNPYTAPNGVSMRACGRCMTQWQSDVQPKQDTGSQPCHFVFACGCCKTALTNGKCPLHGTTSYKPSHAIDCPVCHSVELPKQEGASAAAKWLSSEGWHYLGNVPKYDHKAIAAMLEAYALSRSSSSSSEGEK